MRAIILMKDVRDDDGAFFGGKFGEMLQEGGEVVRHAEAPKEGSAKKDNSGRERAPTSRKTTPLRARFS